MLSDDGTRGAHGGGGGGRDQARRTAAESTKTQTQAHQAAQTAARTGDPAAKQEAMKSQTCVEFLHIMKEFSESSCNASETVQRVDSLVHQDEHLLRLFPLSKEQDGGHQRRQDRDDQEPEDEECKSTDEDNSMNGDEDEEAESMDVDSDEVGNSGNRRLAKNDSAMDETQDELDRWIELDLEFDHQMDVFDFNLDQGSASGSSAPELTAQSVFGRQAAANSTSVLADSSSMHEAGKYLATTGSSNHSMPTAANALGVTIRSSLPASAFDKKSMTAALFEYDDEDDEESAAARSPLLNSRAVLERQLSAVEREDETKDDETNVWGRADDEYQQDLLSNIDHAVLCDRENRFLQWGLEIEAQQQQQQQLLSTPPAASAMAQSFSRRLSMESGATGAASVPADQLRLVMASSPREKMAKSPSNVDIVDDWSSLDFGTFQNRTVSHILSSCLHKRKLQHPYKNQVKLVNFHIPSTAEGTGEGSEKLQPHLGGSLATSLAFGTQQEDGLSGSVGAESVLGSRFMSAMGDSDAAAPSMMQGGAKPGMNAVPKGERKPKKREERKRLMVQKMQDTFADFEVAFTEQELDVKGIHSGSMSKMALSKLENLPLPDLTNLPHDLRELKRKIDATEHKVEGTKHRHRKGGPCPRCQVQNQLRAAKRAYHKRAVAHKKLPQILANSNGSASSAASLPVSMGATATASPLRVGIPAASLATSAGSGSKGLMDPLRNAAKPSLPVSVVLPGAGAVSSVTQPATNGVGVRATMAQNAADQKKTGFASANAAGGSSLVVSVGTSSMPNSSNAPSAGLMHQRHHLANGTASSMQLASAATSFQARARRPCGNAAASFPSPSSSVTSSSSTSTPSSPETQPPQVQHVTVSSA